MSSDKEVLNSIESTLSVMESDIERYPLWRDRLRDEALTAIQQALSKRETKVGK